MSAKLAILKRVLGSWYAPAALGLALLIAIAVWMMPTRTAWQVWSEDGQLHVNAAWDTSRWQAVAVWWRPILGLTLLLSVLLIVLRYSRGWLLAKATAARFFLASVVLHGLLLLGMGAVGVGHGIVADARRISEGEAPLALNGLGLFTPAGRPAYAKLADPETPAGDAVADLPRQVGAPAEVIDRTANPRLPDLTAPRPLAPPERAFVPAPQADTAPVPLERRRVALNPVEERSDVPALAPVESARAEPQAARPAELARQEAPAPAPADAGAPRTLPQSRIETPFSPAAMKPESPAVEEIARVPLPAPRRPAPTAEIARPTEKVDAVPSVPAKSPGQEPPGARVALDRRESPGPSADRSPAPGRPAELPRATQPGGPGELGPLPPRTEGKLPESQPSVGPLPRTTARAGPPAAAPMREPAAAALPPSRGSEEKSLPGPEVALPRATASGPAAGGGATTGGGPQHMPASRLTPGDPSGQPLGDAPRVASADAPLRRRTAGMAPPAPVVDRFSLREERPASVEKFGGTPESEAAVERGLVWLAAHQNRDGSWSVDNFPACCDHPKCTGAGTVHADAAATGLALLPFLGAGYTHQAGKHKATVGRGLKWLIQHQQADGGLTPKDEYRAGYGQGIAALALCEAYGMTGDADLKGPAQKTLDWAVKAQHPGSGGWRYTPNQAADTSVTGWQVMALRSGEMAGLKVDPAAFDGVKRWLVSVEGNRPTGGVFGYQSTTATPAMTAQALLSLQLMGTRRTDPRLKAGTDYLLANLPRADGTANQTSYYWYQATQVMFHVQGEPWKKWNDRCRDLLVSTQETKGGLAGSWPPVDAREKVGGRLFATSLRLLMLEVYYRHLPIYQQLEK
jgi:hypothetical protein